MRRQRDLLVNNQTKSASAPAVVIFAQGALPCRCRPTCVLSSYSFVVMAAELGSALRHVERNGVAIHLDSTPEARRDEVICKVCQMPLLPGQPRYGACAQHHACGQALNTAGKNLNSEEKLVQHFTPDTMLIFSSIFEAFV